MQTWKLESEQRMVVLPVQHVPSGLNLFPVPVRLIQQAMALLQLGSNERLSMSFKVFWLEVCQHRC